MIPAIWAEVVGPWYARHTRVVRVWEGIVDVRCDSAARAQQLQLDSAEIMRRLNARLGAPYVRQIRPSSGAVMHDRRQMPETLRRSLPPAPTEEELAAIDLTPQEDEWIRQQASRIANDDAREAFKRAVRSHLKLRRWKLSRGWQQCSTCGELYDPCHGCPCKSR